MDKDQFQTLINKLDTLTKLYAFNLTREKSVNDQIKILNNLGLRPSEIASVLGKNKNQVYVTLNSLKKVRKNINSNEVQAKQEVNG